MAALCPSAVERGGNRNMQENWLLFRKWGGKKENELLDPAITLDLGLYHHCHSRISVNHWESIRSGGARFRYLRLDKTRGGGAGSQNAEGASK